MNVPTTDRNLALALKGAGLGPTAERLERLCEPSRLKEVRALLLDLHDEALSALGSSASPSSPQTLVDEGGYRVMTDDEIDAANEPIPTQWNTATGAVGERGKHYRDFKDVQYEALSTAGSPVPQPSEGLSLSMQNDPLAIGALLDDSTRTKEFYAGVVYEIQKLIGREAFEAPTTELPKLVAERLAGPPVPSSELEQLVKQLQQAHALPYGAWSDRGERIEEAMSALLAWGKADPSSQSSDPQDGLLHPAHQVFFRAGLIACREYMARFVEAQDPTIANSIRANWWPSLGQDFGPPRKLDFGEVTEGEYGTPSFRAKTADEVSPTQEALPIALGFLELGKADPSSPAGTVEDP